jgi:hypothetical protein
MKAKEFIPAEKPRNFVAKNAKMGGAGQHKDKKKAEKQGDLKHKKSLMPMETVLRDKEDYYAKRKALDDLGRNKDVDQKAVTQRKLDLEKEAKKKGISEGRVKELMMDLRALTDAEFQAQYKEANTALSKVGTLTNQIKYGSETKTIPVFDSYSGHTNYISERQAAKNELYKLTSEGTYNGYPLLINDYVIFQEQLQALLVIPDYIYDIPSLQLDSFKNKPTLISFNLSPLHLCV